MCESVADSEEAVNYNLLFCHACLSFDRKLSSVGKYIDIYLKICDNSRMNLTSQINICWECLALLKKVRAFRKKVENAQKILEYCVNKQAPLLDVLISTKTTTIDRYPNSEDENADENEYLEPDKSLEDYSLDDSNLPADETHEDDELMFKIEDVRSMCGILDANPPKSSPSEVSVKEKPKEPSTVEELRHRRWKRSVLLVYKRICGHRYARHFTRPVSDELAPLYSRIVRRPTDLSTIRRLINNGLIRTTAEFTRALLLMFSNALMYNSSFHEIYPMALEFREETLRELSLLRAAEARGASPGAPPPPPPAPEPAPLRAAPPPPPPPRRISRRRATMREQQLVDTQPPPAKLTRRRATMWEKEPAGTEPPPAKTTRRKATMQDQEPVATDPPPAKPTRRKATMQDQELVATELSPAKLSRRRATMWEQEQDVQKPAAPKTRRASLWSPEPEEPEAPEAPAAPSRRRPKWDWPGIDDKYLVANCFKKYKSLVPL